uniref:Uncharacterized protein n=1 Tax=Anguilla anguilla TaxID=7936 RepID=A0A0E9V423_ANGAN
MVDPIFQSFIIYTCIYVYIYTRTCCTYIHHVY